MRATNNGLMEEVVPCADRESQSHPRRDSQCRPDRTVSHETSEQVVHRQIETKGARWREADEI
jgi:hypothetical protein